MLKKLSLPEQRLLLKSLPAHRHSVIEKECRACSQKGEGVKKIMKKIGDFLGPIAKEVGPVVLRELVLPFLLIKSKQSIGLPVAIPGTVATVKKGGALKLAGQGISPAGAGVVLAGQGKSSRPKKGSQEAKDRMAKIRAMRK